MQPGQSPHLELHWQPLPPEWSAAWLGVAESFTWFLLDRNVLHFSPVAMAFRSSGPPCPQSPARLPLTFFTSHVSLQVCKVCHRTGLDFALVLTGALRGKQQCNDEAGQNDGLAVPSNPLVSKLLSKTKGTTRRVFTYAVHGGGSAQEASNQAALMRRVHAKAKIRHMVRRLRKA